MAYEYHRDAVSIVEGKGIVFPENWNPSDTWLLIHPPGYPIYIAAIYHAFGDSYFVVQVFQNAINSLSPVLIFLIAGNLLTWPVGLASGLLAAASHHFSYYSNFILPDSLCALPILLAFYLLVRTKWGRRPLWIYALAGAMVGLSVWLRPNTLLLGFFITIFFPLISTRKLRAARRAWVTAVASVFVIAPITIRNYIVFGEFVLVSINTGIVLWEGIADAGGQRFGAVSSDGEVIAQEALLYNDRRYRIGWSWPDGIKRDRDRIKRSINVIICNPLWFTKAMVWRMGEMFKYSAHAPLVFRSTDRNLIEVERQVGDEKRKGETGKSGPAANISLNDRSRSASLAFGETISWTRPVARILQRTAKETGLFFILIGLPVVIILSRRRGLFLGMIPVYYLLIQSTMHLEFRYTLPMHYFVFVFAATTWVLVGFYIWSMTKRLISFYRKGKKQDVFS